jgi:hypothetical protein
MLTDISVERLLAMTDRELRLLDNIKKAIQYNDQAERSGKPEDHCLEQLFKGIDTAQRLRRSLRGEDLSYRKNRDRFIEFLAVEIPCAARGSAGFPLIETETGKSREFTLGEIAYAVRCKIHENENLNADENPDYHVVIDWSQNNQSWLGEIENGKLRLNGWFLSHRLREILCGFVSGIQFAIDVATGKGAEFSIRPPLGSIVPNRGRQ